MECRLLKTAQRNLDGTNGRGTPVDMSQMTVVPSNGMDSNASDEDF